MYYIVLIVVYIAIALYFKSKADKSACKGTEALLAGIIAVFLLFYLFDYIASVEHIKLVQPLKSLSYMVSNLLVPLGYIFTCKRCNVKVMSSTTFGVFFLIMFNVITSGTVYLDWTNVEHSLQTDGIHFYLSGNEALTMEMFEVVTVLQIIWIIVRTCILWQKTQNEKFKTSKKGRHAFIAIGITCLAMLIDCFIPDSIRLLPAVLVLHYLEHFALATVLVYMVFAGYLEDIFVDDNEEVAYIEVKPKYADLKAKLDAIMKEEKLYLDSNISLEDVARALNTNRTYLTEMIKESYNTSFPNYINRLRVEEAKRLIRSNTANKLEEIALQCGFNRASTFTRTFKAITGSTPHMWRG